MNAKISIIVPVYNAEKHLIKCLDSIVNQSYKNIEIILINDGSTDISGNICDDYKLKDERVIVIHQKNKGIGGARNSGIGIATGDYIAFVDNDDWLDTNMYQKLLNIALKNDLDIVECDMIETSDQELIAENKNIDKVLIENPKQAYLRILGSGGFFLWKRIYKAHIVKNYQFVLNTTSDDLYFVVDNIKKANRLGYITDVLYYYRINPSSVTRKGYSLKRFSHSIESGLYLQKMLTNIYDESFNLAVKKSLLLKCLMHYKLLNYRPKLDTNYVNRKKLKSLIDENYFHHKNHDFYLKLARFSSIKLFELFIKINKLKHKILKTNQI